MIDVDQLKKLGVKVRRICPLCFQIIKGKRHKCPMDDIVYSTPFLDNLSEKRNDIVLPRSAK